MTTYKGFDIRYDQHKDTEWPNGCYRGIKYTSIDAITTKLCHSIAEVKKEIDQIEEVAQ